MAHDRAGIVWLYAFAAALALTIQAKVTGGLVLVIALNYLLVSRELGLLSVRRVLLAGLDVHSCSSSRCWCSSR